MKAIGFGVALALFVPTMAQEPLSKLDWLKGEWRGTLAQKDVPFETEVVLRVSREGKILLLELERKQLLGVLVERAYLSWNPKTSQFSAISDCHYVSDVRRDAVTVGNGAVSFQSKPWNIGTADPLLLNWSLTSGRLVPALKARIYIDMPTIAPSANALVMTWTGILGAQQLGIEQGTLFRAGTMSILR